MTAQGIAVAVAWRTAEPKGGWQCLLAEQGQPPVALHRAPLQGTASLMVQMIRSQGRRRLAHGGWRLDRQTVKG